MKQLLEHIVCPSTQHQGENTFYYSIGILCKACVCVHMSASSVYVRWALWGHCLIKEGFGELLIFVLSDSYICVHSISALNLCFGKKHLSDQTSALIFRDHMTVIIVCLLWFHCLIQISSSYPFLCANVCVRLAFKAFIWCHTLWMQLHNKFKLLRHWNTSKRAKGRFILAQKGG